MPLEIPRDSKFVVLTFPAEAVDSLDEIVQLDEHLFAVKGPSPVPLEDHWRGSLGTMESDYFDETAFSIAAVKPGVGAAHDADHQWLDSRAYALLYGLTLLGALRFYDGQAFALTGRRLDRSPDVQSLGSRLDPYYRLPDFEEQPLDEACLRHALALADSITRLFKIQVTQPLTMPGQRPFQDHIRVRRGFNVLLKAFSARSPNERIHQFIRAVDAILKTPVYESRPKFRYRGAFFVGDCQETSKVLLNLYDLRSAEEHLNDWRTVEPDERTLRFRAVQAEWLACQLYVTLLECPALLQKFLSDDSTDAFWKREQHVVRSEFAALLPSLLKLTKRELERAGLARQRDY